MKSIRRPSRVRPVMLSALLGALSATGAHAQDSRRTTAQFSPTQQRGIDFLLSNQENGRFFLTMPGRGGGKPQKMFDVGLTGLALAAIQSKPAAQRSIAENKVIESGLAWIVSQQSDDGSFGRRTVVYATSSVVFALAKAGRPEFKQPLAKARHFLQVMQNIEGRNYKASDVDYGSFGYGNNERGDLSNTNFAIQAMREAGVAADDEGLVKAIVFLQRLQNRRESNDLEVERVDPKTKQKVKLVSGDDGGATYYPGDSPAGFHELADGKRSPRSYGSMTYAMLKTYTLCGVGTDDARVQAAVDWIEKNWTVDVNPGADPRLGDKAQYQGLFYYYMVMAQALDAMGMAKLEVPTKDAGAVEVDWRHQLHQKLAALQNEDGSWLNDKNGRWYESMNVICSAYAILALEHCH